MRKINKLVIHCSATKSTQDIGAVQIRNWHTKKGWKDIGYHYVIRRDGTLEDGRPNQIAGAHVKGHNKDSLGICLVGGLDKNSNPESNFTKKQLKTARSLIRFLQKQYDVCDAYILGHRDFPKVNKRCPCFDVQLWLLKNKVTKS